MKNRAHILLAASIALSLFLAGLIRNDTGMGTVAWAQPCQPNTVGIDTSVANTSRAAAFGRAWGQVFLAEDTLLQSITVWRKNHAFLNLDPMHLYITEVDSLDRPISYKILLDGPSIVIPTIGDGITPDKVQYVFDPPLQLPYPGKFFFAIKEEWCDFVFELLASSANPYPDGKAWRMEPLDLECLGLGCCPVEFGGVYDLIFEVEFCKPPTTDVPFPKGDSWGRVKGRYR